MKRTVAILLASLLLICTGCGLWNDTANEPLIVVHSSGEAVEPYEQFRNSTSWSTNGWVAADHFYLVGELEELSKSFPTVIYGDDFEIRCHDKVNVTGLSVYDTELEPIKTNATQNFLNTLSPGTYYILIRVAVHGNYVAAGKGHESSGYDCGYKLIVD